MAEADTALRHSPLDAEHRALGARMAPFGGWEMPIQFSSVLEEHRACREHAVAFDVSHLGSVRVAGAGAYALLQWAFTNDLARIEPGRADIPPFPYDELENKYRFIRFVEQTTGKSILQQPQAHSYDRSLHRPS